MMQAIQLGSILIALTVPVGVSIGQSILLMEKTISGIDASQDILGNLDDPRIDLSSAISLRSFAQRSNVSPDHHERNSPVEQGDSSEAADSHHSEDVPPPFGTSLTENWLDPWPHTHFSQRGTPFVHLFLTEPAFLDRDLFMDYRMIRGDDGYEVELEVELEWAITRRIGVVIETPYEFLNPNGSPDERGLGDMAIAPRFLLVDTERFMFSGNLGVALPTGNERRGLGSGEISLSPTVSWWYDLGNWFTFQGQVGTDHALESGDSEFLWNFAFTYSFLGPSLNGTSSGDSTYGGRHYPPGLINLITEVTGRTALDGEQDNRSSAEILFGISYLITSDWEVRGAVQVPLFEPRELSSGFIFGLIRHF